jgi:NADP-dependent 3-hydroxy acid dehydrogenase YdfG
VVLAARRVDELEETARRCRAQGAEALAVRTDVTDGNRRPRLGTPRLFAPVAT